MYIIFVHGRSGGDVPPGRLHRATPPGGTSPRCNPARQGIVPLVGYLPVEAKFAKDGAGLSICLFSSGMV